MHLSLDARCEDECWRLFWIKFFFIDASYFSLNYKRMLFSPCKSFTWVVYVRTCLICLWDKIDRQLSTRLLLKLLPLAWKPWESLHELHYSLAQIRRVQEHYVSCGSLQQVSYRCTYLSHPSFHQACCEVIF